MNKEKLIGMIIKKETYKNTKPVQADVLRLKQEAVNVSIASIYEILKEQYNPEAKLYAVRYLKDCFQKGNNSFIVKTETKILPLLVNIVLDSNDQNAIKKYGGSYTKNSDLQKFKSLVTSLFTMSRQCIEQWAMWIPDPSRGFVQAREKVKMCKPDPLKKGFVYFRKENELLFKQNCLKNGVELPQSESLLKQQSLSKLSEPKIHPPVQNMPVNELSNISKQSKNKPVCKATHKIQLILEESKIKIQQRSMSEKQLGEIEAKFNAAINEYIQSADQFDEQFLEARLEQFEVIKIQNNSKRGVKIEERIEETIKINIKNLEEEFPSKQAHEKIGSSSFKTPNQEAPFEKASNHSRAADQPKIVRRQEAGENSKMSSKISVPQKNSSIQRKQADQESRVNFEQSESDEVSNSSRNQNMMSLQKKTTAKFNDPQIVSFQQKVSAKVNDSQSEKVQFNSSYSLNGGRSSLPYNELLKMQEENLKSQESQKQLESKIMLMEREMSLMKEKENKLINQFHNSVHPSDLDRLKKQLYQEKAEKSLLNQEINELKNEMRRLKNQMDKNREEWKSFNSNSPSNFNPNSPHEQSGRGSQVSQGSYKVKKVKKSSQMNKQEVEVEGSQLRAGNFQQDRILYSPRLDEDYINNVTHFSKIGSWLSEANITRFKKAILGKSQVFFENEDLTISSFYNLYSEDLQDYLKISYSFHFRRYQEQAPKTTYKNIPEIDLWTKAITGKQEVFVQQTVGRLCSSPIKLMKGAIHFGNCNASFILPFMFFNYLRPAEFEDEQFSDIYESMHENIIKSKVIRLNQEISSSPKQLKNIFKQSSMKSSKLQLCLSEQSYERVFMVQIEILRNQKAVVRVLPIPAIGSMAVKAKQLLNNIVFLLAQ